MPRERPLPIDVAHRLLMAAERELAHGLQISAEKKVDRALRLPWDELDDVDTAVNVAGMLILSAVTDALDECEVEESSWLQAAEAVLDRCGDHAREEILRLLRIIARDRDIEEWALQRIRRRIAPGDPRGPLDEVPARARRPDQERRRLVLDYLTAINDFSTEFSRRRRSWRSMHIPAELPFPPPAGVREFRRKPRW